MKKLQIGDKIYATHNNDIGGILEIARTTPTLGITPGGMKFKINTTDNGFCHKVSKDDSWLSSSFGYRTYYQLETPELKEIWQKQRLVQKFSKFDFNKLDLKTLSEINNKLT